MNRFFMYSCIFLLPLLAKSQDYSELAKELLELTKSEGTKAIESYISYLLRPNSADLIRGISSASKTVAYASLANTTSVAGLNEGFEKIVSSFTRLSGDIPASIFLGEVDSPTAKASLLTYLKILESRLKTIDK